MNALLNIAIRVQTQGAQQLTIMQRQIMAMQSGLGNAFAGASQGLQRFGGFLQHANNRLSSFGKNLQWTGQQLTMRFTLPIALAFGIATKAIMENEKAFTRLAKVYDEAELGGRAEELRILNEIGLELSNLFGVAREQVTETMAAFAQAGAQGTQVALLTRQAIELSILADMDLVKATEALIVVQAQFRFSNEELHDSIAQLNAIENATAVSTEDLLAGIQRAGSTAAASGTELNELAALIAGLVPAYATAAQAGNALRSIFVRLTSDAKDVKNGIKDVVGAQNLQTFYTSTGIEQLKMLAAGFNELDDSQKVYYAGQIAGTYQAGKFLGIMDQINTAQSAYNTALQKSSDLEQARATYRQELETALKSDPRQVEMAFNRIRNSLAELVAMAMPTIMQLVGMVSVLVQKFNELSPETRRWILIVAAALAVVGPLVSYVGSLILLFSTMLKPLIAFGRALVWLIPLIVKATGAMISFGLSFLIAHPYIFLIVAALAAAAIAFIFFRDDIEKILKTVWSDVSGFASRIANAFKLMFTSIVGAVSSGVKTIFDIFNTGLTAIARFIASAVKVIWELLSYLNPFARHSPSLVEEVDRGVDAIVAKYGELDKIAAPIRRAAAELRAFRDATLDVRTYLAGVERGEQRAAVEGFSPGALPQFDALVATLAELEGLLPGLSAEIDQQAALVRELEAAMAALDMRIEHEERILSDLEDSLSALGDELQAAKERLSEFANTPIEGERAMSDAIFENEMAIKALRLELMALEDANPEIEGLTDQFNALNAAIEEARGREKELRLMGAGGDVLGPLQGQIAMMEAARNAMMDDSGLGGPAAEMEALRAEIERLEREGERLDLQESLQFDPLRREIDQLVEGLNELPFDQIVAGIQREQAEIARLTHEYDQQEAAVEQQRRVVENLREERELLSAQLDVERNKLQALEEMYSTIESAIRAIETELSNWAQLATAAAQAAKSAAEEAARATGDLEDAFGSGIAGMAGGADELQGILDELKNQAALDMEEMKKSFDDLVGKVKGAFGGIEEAFNTFMGFLHRWVIGPFMLMMSSIGDVFRSLYDTAKYFISLVIGLFIELPARALSALATWPGKMLEMGTKVMEGLWYGMGQIWGKIWGWLSSLEKGDIAKVFENAASWLIDAGQKILSGLWWGMGEIWSKAWNWLGGLAGELWNIFKDAGTWLIDAGKDIIEGLWKGIVNAPFDIAGAILDKLPDIPGVGKGELLKRYMEEGRHGGGVVGMDLPMSLSRPYGLRADEYSTILRAGETVFTPGQMKALGSVISGTGGGDVNIYGNLEFPNVTGGGDAEEFIRNLESLSS